MLCIQHSKLVLEDQAREEGRHLQDSNKLTKMKQTYLGDCCSQGCFPVINMTNSSNVKMRLSSAVQIVAHWPAEVQHVLGKSLAGGCGTHTDRRKAACHEIKTIQIMHSTTESTALPTVHGMLSSSLTFDMPTHPAAESGLSCIDSQTDAPTPPRKPC